MNRLLFSLKACQNSGAHFSENKKNACGNVPTSSGLSEITGAIFLEKKKRLRQRTHKFRASRNPGAIFSGKKGACGNVPTSSGLPKIWAPFSWRKKKRLRQRSQPLRASKKSGTIFQKYFVQKPAKPATDLSHNGHQKIDLVQKPFRLLFPATISLKSF